MWTTLILSVLLVHCLVALPAPNLNDRSTESWSANKACQEVDSSVMIENKNDSTCATYIYCYIADGSTRALIKSCKTNQYFNAELKFCSVNKSEGCE
ncbi:uncharacterized protein LOC108040377 [Drosophila rhopaloa]|uniref:Uncharacterized protein LOC108040377 n=1 Tax=Drosophila rhopaloa TaxID=1041015 RepID=A0A6P4EJ97_DRORH|nr:uncharacterized protein LOC108040377 [Drosophila rhopaloa]